MTKFIVSIGCTAAMLIGSNVALAQGRGSGGSKAKAPAAAAPKGGGSVAHGGGKTATPHSTAQGGGKAHGTTTKTTHGGTNAKATPKVNEPKPKSTTTANSTTTKNSQTTLTATGTLTPVQQKLQRNTNLASKLESRLPKGTDLMAASEGFRSLGQFVAAVNVANNHDLDFAKLKTAMVEDGMSLGQAMKDQRSTLDSTTESTRAQREADALIRSTETSSETSTATKAKPRPSKGIRP